MNSGKLPRGLSGVQQGARRLMKRDRRDIRNERRLG